MMEATARQTALHNTIYKRKKRLRLSAYDRGKSLYQAVSASLPTGNKARTAYLLCIKLGTNIDPPYNTGNDFVYEDDFSEETGEFLRRDGQYDEQGNRLTPNLDSNGRFHTDWLNMMYPRLRVARDLLADDGVIFISIDDNEMENLKNVCNEMFGRDNALPVVIRRCKVGGGADNKQFAREADFVLGYAKSINSISAFSMPHTEENLRRYNNNDEKGRYFWDTYSRSGLLIGSPDTDALYYEVIFPDGTKRSDRWRRSRERLSKDLAEGEAKYTKISSGWNIHFKQRLNPDGKRPRQILYENMGNTLANDQLKDLGFKGLFDYPKPVELLHLLAQLCTIKNDRILDFFSGRSPQPTRLCS
ncbi:MAG: site-specific DNA-methyltransferase [Candidatus Syntrophopropionicum ammoniitolerans]